MCGAVRSREFVAMTRQRKRTSAYAIVKQYHEAAAIPTHRSSLLAGRAGLAWLCGCMLGEGKRCPVEAEDA